ncbi:hypothetical protein lerEdw1_002668 [Lerista edwardsae]|nr:hypothetical protein lerEdw1_002668 [Lerista edwardsae]
MAPKKDKGKKDAPKDAKGGPPAAPGVPECCPPIVFYPMLTFFGLAALGGAIFVFLQIDRVKKENQYYKEDIKALRLAIAAWMSDKEFETKTDNAIVRLTHIHELIEEELQFYDRRRIEYDNCCMNSIPSVKPGGVEEKRRIFAVLYLEEPEDKAKAWPTKGFIDTKRERFWKPYGDGYYYFSRRKKNWYEAERISSPLNFWSLPGLAFRNKMQ